MSWRRKSIVEITTVALIYGLIFLSGFLHVPDSTVLRYDLPPVAMEALSLLVCCIFAMMAVSWKDRRNSRAACHDGGWRNGFLFCTSHDRLYQIRPSLGYRAGNYTVPIKGK